MRNWYSIKAAANNSAEISIYDEIGMWGVTAKDFIADLKRIDAKQITLSINSPGGSVFDGFAIFNALKASGAEITVKVMGIAASMASVIAMVGKKRIMPANAMMMTHNAISGVYGDAENLREVADVLDKIDDSIVATYVAATGLTEGKVRDLMAADTFMSAAEALENGFITEVIDEVKVSASFDTERLPESVQALFKASAKPNNDGIEQEADDTEEDEEDPRDVTAFADQVSALADKAGFGEFAAIWALGKTDIPGVEAAIAEAREIKSLCALAKQDNAAFDFIKAGTPLAKVREDLCARLAAADVKNHTDTTRKTSSTPQTPAQPVAIKTADIWAARRSQIKS